MNELPSSMACLRNREPILNILKNYFHEDETVLEIGHGTGEHAEFFAKNLPVIWQPADQAQHNWMMIERSKIVNLPNLKPPFDLTIGPKVISEQANQKFNHVFTANTLHIMSEELALKLCSEVSEVINNNGYFLIYGPFKFNGEFTSESNASFDLSLKSRDELSGIRDFEKLEQVLKQYQINFLKRYDLPANNQILIFQKA